MKLILKIKISQSNHLINNRIVLNKQKETIIYKKMVIKQKILKKKLNLFLKIYKINLILLKQKLQRCKIIYYKRKKIRNKFFQIIQMNQIFKILFFNLLINYHKKRKTK